MPEEGIQLILTTNISLVVSVTYPLPYCPHQTAVLVSIFTRCHFHNYKNQVSYWFTLLNNQQGLLLDPLDSLTLTETGVVSRTDSETPHANACVHTDNSMYLSLYLQRVVLTLEVKWTILVKWQWVRDSHGNKKTTEVWVCGPASSELANNSKNNLNAVGCTIPQWYCSRWKKKAYWSHFQKPLRLITMKHRRLCFTFNFLDLDFHWREKGH